MNLSDIAILNIKGSDYCCIISLISKNEALNLMDIANLTKKKRNIINQTPRATVKLQIYFKFEFK